MLLLCCLLPLLHLKWCIAGVCLHKIMQFQWHQSSQSTLSWLPILSSRHRARCWSCLCGLQQLLGTHLCQNFLLHSRWWVWAWKDSSMWGWYFKGLGREWKWLILWILQGCSFLVLGFLQLILLKCILLGLEPIGPQCLDPQLPFLNPRGCKLLEGLDWVCRWLCYWGRFLCLQHSWGSVQSWCSR